MLGSQGSLRPDPELTSGREASKKIVGYYSYLFTYPSRPRMMVAIVLITVGAASASFFMRNGASCLTRGLLYGALGLATPLLASDEVVSRLFRGEPLLNPRRFTIISFSTSIVYGALAVLSSIVGVLLGRTDMLFRGILLAVAISTSLRHLVIQVFATEGSARNFTASFLQPALCLATTAYFSPTGSMAAALGLLACAVFVTGSQILLMVLGRWGGENPNVMLTRLFRAFVLAWAEELPGPLEEEITKLGEVKDLAVDSLLFTDSKGGNIAVMVVPYIHPGPFRNVGGSGLPTVISDALKRRLGCEILVTHGVSNHEKDITRAEDAERIPGLISIDSGKSGGDLASPLMWGRRDGAQASCQLFGDIALFTLSLSPMSYDDLPDRVAKGIMKAAESRGLRAVVVDSHNSIGMDGVLEECDPKSMQDAAMLALEGSLASPRSHYYVGASRVTSFEWGLDEGMGPEGIAVLVVKLEGGQTTVYVVVDGNNMISGLRERIIDAIRGLGVEEAEVVTSDTHLVNAIGATTRGYYPIGEMMEWRKVVEYVLGAVEGAELGRGKARLSYSRDVVEGLTVLGADGINTLSGVLESGFDLFKRTGLALTAASLLLAGGLLYLL